MSDVARQFIVAACVTRDAGHRDGTLDEAERIRLAHPELEQSSIFVAAILGDDAGVRQWIDADRANATKKGGPYDWDPLTYLCFSRYLRLDPTRSTGFVRAATLLLDAGADANTGWFEASHQPRPVWESALYGAAGVAHHAELTRLLLARGADPNDGETPYHAPETYDNSVLEALLDSGKLTAESLATLLVRKADWHDLRGVELLLAHGADPNYATVWRVTPLQQAVRRDNALETIERMLDAGGDLTRTCELEGRSGAAVAARRGRRDILESLARRGVTAEMSGADALVTACAMSDQAAIDLMKEHAPELVGELLTDGGRLLAEFAGVGNTAGVAALLDIGVPVSAVFAAGDGYWEIAPASTALHVAAWRLRADTVRLLLDRGATVDAKDAIGRTPLTLAVRACVDSYWSERRTPDIVEALLRAGASTQGVRFPSGYQAVDALLAQHGATA